MTKSDEKYFVLLKGKIGKTMRKTYPGIPDSISDWKGQNIIDFQSELKLKQKQHLSEKWFYTHMKSENSNLPRIDILNFLSQYVGYRNWEDLKHSNSGQTDRKENEASKRKTYLLPLFILIILTISYFTFKSFYSQEYTFCFYDSVSKQAISNQIIEVTLLDRNESDRNYLCNADGCFSLKTNKTKIKFIVDTPYYQSDTIVRRLSSFNRSESIKLQLDNYAIMIHYFSKNKVQDWLKRRDDLDHMFSDNAKIFQVYEGTVGMEIYNKWEFINKLSIPTQGLRDIEILNTKYKGDEISYLCFKQNGAD